MKDAGWQERSQIIEYCRSLEECDRAAYLDAACEGNEELLHEVTWLFSIAPDWSKPILAAALSHGMLARSAPAALRWIVTVHD